ncbi:hypothetical protein LOZ57_004112 [Ophidiomyces ophidiicola]|uniref:uncharacterized protein n=1 Tax=Ophidiomyces ophidiicola TaxID=1387563 RepID=UPI0020C520AB|nr:uncharacterized protein LOZ57_004112 [Ophidiomyces ophidiicola]KAI1945426.1 hypothetical protein LOZ57_004112 [Ophidiomyces ophidiicola]KAI2046522.1 hypothetical protein LOZ43_005845 [Ophidiomyces ophidiicola]
MVLITSGTISVVISTSIIGISTFLLFLSGYVLQQQSVRNIQAALPKYTALPTPAVVPQTPLAEPGVESGDSLSPENRVRRPASDLDVQNPFTTLPNYKRAFQQAALDGSAADASLNKQAYLQVLSKPSAADICSTLLFAKTMASNSTLATDRIIIYPESWDRNSPTANIAAALRILLTSSKDYNAITYAIDMNDLRDRHPSTTRLLKRASARLRSYERLLYLQAPGVAADVNRLDQLLLSLEQNDVSARSPPRPWLSWPFRNKDDSKRTWVPTQLSITVRDLPSAALILSRYLRSGMISRRSHVLSTKARRSYVDSVMGALDTHNQKSPRASPSYVYFEKSKNRLQERNSVYYLEWRRELEKICGGIDLSD